MKLSEISSKSLFKLGLTCGGMFWLFFGLLFGVLALFEFQTVRVNQEPIFGLAGFFASLLMAAVFSVLSALALTLGGMIARIVPQLRDMKIEQSALLGLDDYVDQADPD